MTQPTAEDRMGKLPKVAAIAFILATTLLLLAAAVGLYGYLSKPVMRVPFEQLGSKAERHVMRPAAPVDGLKL